MARNRNTRLQIDSRQFPDWEEYEQEGLFTRIVAKLGFLFRKSATIDAPLSADGEDIPAIDAVNDRLLIQDATDDAVKLVAPEDLVSLVPSLTTDVKATPNVIPIRDANGTFKVGTPTDAAHPATKSYVDALSFPAYTRKSTNHGTAVGSAGVNLPACNVGEITVFTGYGQFNRTADATILKTPTSGSYIILGGLVGMGATESAVVMSSTLSATVDASTQTIPANTRIYQASITKNDWFVYHVALVRVS